MDVDNCAAFDRMSSHLGGRAVKEPKSTSPPSTARVDRVRKVPIYAREGVGHLWLVDPLQQTLEVFRLEGQHWVLVSTHGGAESVRAAPFEAIELDMDRWWLESESERT